MGFLDKIKGLIGGRKNEIKDGIDKGADAIGSKVGDHADKVEAAAETAKDGVDKLSGD